MTENPDASRHVLVELDGPALWVRLDRTEKANAYTAGMLDALERAVRQAEANPDIRVLVFTGSGDRVFCAGADRNELEARSWRSVLRLRSAAVFRLIRESPLVSMAAINGAAVGGGLELALACDLRVAVEGARFWLPEPEFGLLPAAGALTFLPGIVGQGRARELILGGARWTAKEAYTAGLVSQVVAPADLRSAVVGWVARVAQRDGEALHLAKLALEETCPAPSGALDRVGQALLVQKARRLGEALDT